MRVPSITYMDRKPNRFNNKFHIRFMNQQPVKKIISIAAHDRNKYSNMSKEQAEFVKELRVTKGYTWRAVHREWQKKYVPQNQWWDSYKDYDGVLIPIGNQIDGRDICYAAMDVLNEEIDDGWN